MAKTIQCVDCGASLSAKEKQKASHTCDACDLAHRNDFDRRRAYDDDGVHMTTKTTVTL